MRRCGWYLCMYGVVDWTSSLPALRPSAPQSMVHQESGPGSREVVSPTSPVRLGTFNNTTTVLYGTGYANIAPIEIFWWNSFELQLYLMPFESLFLGAASRFNSSFTHLRISRRIRGRRYTMAINSSCRPRRSRSHWTFRSAMSRMCQCCYERGFDSCNVQGSRLSIKLGKKNSMGPTRFLYWPSVSL